MKTYYITVGEREELTKERADALACVIARVSGLEAAVNESFEPARPLTAKQLLESGVVGLFKDNPDAIRTPEEMRDGLAGLAARESDRFPDAGKTIPRDADGVEWKVGDECECYDVIEERYMHGRIKSILADGDIKVQSDDYPSCVYQYSPDVISQNPDRIRRYRRPSPAPSPAIKPFDKLAVGDMVKWRCDGWPHTFKDGEVIRLEADAVVVVSCFNDETGEFRLGPQEYGRDKFFYATADQPSREERWVRLSEWHQHDFRWDSTPQWVRDYIDTLRLGCCDPGFPSNPGDALIRHADGTVTCEKAGREANP